MNKIIYFIIFLVITLIVAGIYLRKSYTETIPDDNSETEYIEPAPSDYYKAPPETLNTEKSLKRHQPISDNSKKTPVTKPTKPTDPYSIGYEDGYEAGYDDGSNGYHRGYQYDTSASRRSASRQSYLKGYSLGYSEGFETGQYDYEDELIEDEEEY
ncbi:MAG: hypothetical protein PHR45_08265 [Muribaculaceae bacterium]|nr:hypothetical protein [Muribaculaceae bacterium]